jgi:sugar phosphate isomerase/epimerase
MTIKPSIARPLGTMIVYGYAEKDVAIDLDLAIRLGANCVEILPHWRAYPDPAPLRRIVSDHGLSIHSAHGSWGGQTIVARRVDLGSLDFATRAESVEDIRRCIDWLADVKGRHLVIHPGGLSDASDHVGRMAALGESLFRLADHARPASITLCVENMPPGVHPGSRMNDIASLVAEIDRTEVRLALDTGHANLVDSATFETIAAGGLLATTHVHDNNGRKDVHLPPCFGVIDWGSWIESLDQIEYTGPIMLECIRYIRDHPEILTKTFVDLLQSFSTVD